MTQGHYCKQCSLNSLSFSDILELLKCMFIFSCEIQPPVATLFSSCVFFLWFFLTLPVVRLPVIKFCCWNFHLALDNLHLPPKVPALSTSAHLSSCIANVLQVWFTDPMILGSPGPSQGLCTVNTIFIVTAIHDLLLPICWQKLWKVLHYGNLLTLTL